MLFVCLGSLFLVPIVACGADLIGEVNLIHDRRQNVVSPGIRLYLSGSTIIVGWCWWVAICQIIHSRSQPFSTKILKRL